MRVSWGRYGKLRTHYMRIDVPSNGSIDILGELGPEWGGDLWDGVGADASLVVDHLLGVVILLEKGEELDDV